MERYFCNICNNQLKIMHGDLLFKYNIECINGHKNINISINDLLTKRNLNENIFKCQEHQKMALIYCFTCKKEICLYYLKDSHSDHKTQYFHIIKNEEIFPNYPKLKYLNNIYNNFFLELDIFKNRCNLNLDSLKEIFEKEINFVTQIFKNKYITFIDIENIKNFFKPGKLSNHINFFNQFNHFNSYLEKRNYLESIFPNELKIDNNFIEPISEINNKIYEIIIKGLFPINHECYIIAQIHKDFLFFAIIKDISINKEHFEYEVLLQKEINFKMQNFHISHEIKEIVLLDNDKLEKEFSVLIATTNNIFKITIINLYSDIKCNYKNYLLFQNDETNNIIDGLIYLEKDKNIIMKIINKTSQISIYNDLFNEEKIKLKFNYSINDYLKLTKNLFVLSIYQKTKLFQL